MRKKMACMAVSLIMVFTSASAVSAHKGGGHHDRQHDRMSSHKAHYAKHGQKPDRYRSSDLNVYMNGKRFNGTPILHMSTNLVPLRDISQVMGAAVNYDSDTGKITVTKGTNTMVLTVGSKTVYYNGTAEAILVAPLVIDGVTYVPAQVFAKGLHANLNYNKNENALRVAF